MITIETGLDGCPLVEIDGSRCFIWFFPIFPTTINGETRWLKISRIERIVLPKDVNSFVYTLYSPYRVVRGSNSITLERWAEAHR